MPIDNEPFGDDGEEKQIEEGLEPEHWREVGEPQCPDPTEEYNPREIPITHDDVMELLKDGKLDFAVIILQSSAPHLLHDIIYAVNPEESHELFIELFCNPHLTEEDARYIFGHLSPVEKVKAFEIDIMGRMAGTTYQLAFQEGVPFSVLQAAAINHPFGTELTPDQIQFYVACEEEERARVQAEQKAAIKEKDE